MSFLLTQTLLFLTMHFYIALQWIIYRDVTELLNWTKAECCFAKNKEPFASFWFDNQVACLHVKSPRLLLPELETALVLCLWISKVFFLESPFSTYVLPKLHLYTFFETVTITWILFLKIRLMIQIGYSLPSTEGCCLRKREYI